MSKLMVSLCFDVKSLTYISQPIVRSKRSQSKRRQSINNARIASLNSVDMVMFHF
jgi:hypothetical protein